MVVEEIEWCGGIDTTVQDQLKGCYLGYNNNKVILLDEAYVFQPAYLGCNVWTHEVLHAWGYSHEAMLHWFVCSDFKIYSSKS